jgi:hypothetical protein
MKSWLYHLLALPFNGKMKIKVPTPYDTGSKMLASTAMIKQTRTVC